MRQNILTKLRNSFISIFSFLVPILTFHKTRFTVVFMIFFSLVNYKEVTKESIKEFLQKNRREIRLTSTLFLIFFIGFVNFSFLSYKEYMPYFLLCFNKLFFAFLISSIFLVVSNKYISDKVFAENFLKYLFIGFILSAPIVLIDYKTSYFIQKIFMSRKVGYYRLNPGVDCYALMSIFYFLFFTKNKRYLLAIISLSFGFMVSLFGIKFQHTSHTAFQILCVGLLSFAVQKFLSKSKLINFIKISLILMFLFPIVAYFINLNFIGKIENILKLSLVHRICIWHHATIFIKEHSNLSELLFGHGIWSYKLLTERYPQISCILYDLPVFALHPHNFPIELLFETGIFGCITVYLLLLRIFRNFVDLYPLVNAFLFISFCSHSIWSSWMIYFGIFLIFISKLYNISRDFTIKYR